MSATATPTPLTGATAQLVAFICASDSTVEPASRAAVRSLVVDTVGVATAGAATDAGQILTDWIAAENPPSAIGTPGAATVWGTSQAFGPADAALLNGTTAHALDWDDAAPSMAMHPAAVLLPTLFAIAARRPITGTELCDAYNVGSATFRAVSEVLPHAIHYGRGWHNTSTTGRIAATAAASRLLCLDPGTTAHAIGIAASHAAGSLANFGTMTKPMHAGLAARDAVVATGLAVRGFTANPAQLEARGGFLQLFGDVDADPAVDLSDRLQHWQTEWIHDYAIKAYPSCFATQRAIDAAFSLRAELAQDTTLVDHIEVTLEHGGLRPLRDTPPTTGLEAKFSLEYTVAVALCHGEVRLSDFTDDALGRPGLADLMARTTLSERPVADEPGHTIVRLHTTDGQILTRDVHHSRGDSHRPLSADELAAKFTQCVGSHASTPAWFAELQSIPDREEPAHLQTVLAGPDSNSNSRRMS